MFPPSFPCPSSYFSFLPRFRFSAASCLQRARRDGPPLNMMFDVSDITDTRFKSQRENCPLRPSYKINGMTVTDDLKFVLAFSHPSPFLSSWLANALIETQCLRPFQSICGLFLCQIHDPEGAACSCEPRLLQPANPRHRRSPVRLETTPRVPATHGGRRSFPSSRTNQGTSNGSREGGRVTEKERARGRKLRHHSLTHSLTSLLPPCLLLPGSASLPQHELHRGHRRRTAGHSEARHAHGACGEPSEPGL